MTCSQRRTRLRTLVVMAAVSMAVVLLPVAGDTFGSPAHAAGVCTGGGSGATISAGCVHVYSAPSSATPPSTTGSSDSGRKSTSDWTECRVMWDSSHMDGVTLEYGAPGDGPGLKPRGRGSVVDGGTLNPGGHVADVRTGAWRYRETRCIRDAETRGPSDPGDVRWWHRLDQLCDPRDSTAWCNPATGPRAVQLRNNIHDVLPAVSVGMNPRSSGGTGAPRGQTAVHVPAFFWATNQAEMGRTFAVASEAAGVRLIVSARLKHIDWTVASGTSFACGRGTPYSSGMVANASGPTAAGGICAFGYTRASAGAGGGAAGEHHHIQGRARWVVECDVVAVTPGAGPLPPVPSGCRNDLSTYDSARTGRLRVVEMQAVNRRP